MASRGPIHTTRPPFATDLPDSAYRTEQPVRRQLQPQAVNPNNRTSAYNHYDDYTNPSEAQRYSGIGGLMLGGGDDDSSDEEDDEPSKNKHAALIEATQNEQHNLTANKASPIAVPLPALRSPNETRYPDEKKRGQWEGGQMREVAPAPPYAPMSMPTPTHTPAASTPHQLLAPPSPITPAFLIHRDSVRYEGESKAILRGGAEGMIMPRRGAQGDQFWKRFSINAHTGGKKQSSWLSKTINGSKSMSRAVSILSILLIAGIAAAIALGWYYSHNKPAHQAPHALGGGDEEPSYVPSTSQVSSSTVRHVDPATIVVPRAVPSPGWHSRRHNHHI